MKVAYIGRFKENNDAASIRVKNIGRVLRKIGCSVSYFCQEGSGDRIEQDGFKYYFANVEKPKAKVFLEWIFGTKAFKMFLSQSAESRFDMVILYNVTSILAKRVINYCKKRKIKVICDVTEWYDVEDCKRIPLKIVRKFVENRIKKVDKKADGIISISHYLTEYYKHQNIPLIEIPPVFDYIPDNNSDIDNGIPIVVYAGSPSDKDEFNIIIDALRIVNSEKVVVKMDFVGIKKPETDDEFEKYGIRFLPRCSNAEAIKKIANSDYTVLFRRKKRFAMAGYSTKCAESLYNGIPVICNEIGGSDLDIVNGENGIKIKDLTTKSVAEAFLNVANTKYQNRFIMKNKCFDFGKEKYNLDFYVEPMNSFLKGLWTECYVEK